MFFEGFRMQKSSKIPSKIRPRKRTPQKCEKIALFMLFDPLLGAKIIQKRIKIDSQNPLEKQTPKKPKKDPLQFKPE